MFAGYGMMWLREKPTWYDEVEAARKYYREKYKGEPVYAHVSDKEFNGITEVNGMKLIPVTWMLKNNILLMEA